MFIDTVLNNTKITKDVNNNIFVAITLPVLYGIILKDLSPTKILSYDFSRTKTIFLSFSEIRTVVNRMLLKQPMKFVIIVLLIVIKL